MISRLLTTLFPAGLTTPLKCARPRKRPGMVSWCNNSRCPELKGVGTLEERISCINVVNQNWDFRCLVCSLEFWEFRSRSAGIFGVLRLLPIVRQTPCPSRAQLAVASGWQIGRASSGDDAASWTSQCWRTLSACASRQECRHQISRGMTTESEPPQAFRPTN